jgi:hypothetical protein
MDDEDDGAVAPGAAQLQPNGVAFISDGPLAEFFDCCSDNPEHSALSNLTRKEITEKSHGALVVGLVSCLLLLLLWRRWRLSQLWMASSAASG